MSRVQYSARGFALCRSCGEEVAWRRNLKTLKTAPINARVSPTGNVRLLDDGEHYQVLKASEAEAARKRGEPLHDSHFRSCPRAQVWRGNGKARTA